MNYYKSNLNKSDYVKQFSKIMKMTQKYEHRDVLSYMTIKRILLQHVIDQMLS